MLRRLISVGFFLALILVSITASLKFWVESSLDSPMQVSEQGYILEVKSGSSLNQLSRELAGNGFIDSPYPLIIYSRFDRLEHIQVGEYQLEHRITPRQMIAKLVSGDVIQYQVTFPEGRSLSQWIGILNLHPRFEKQTPVSLEMLEEAFDPPEGGSLEGWFFPDTYIFRSVDTAMTILEQAHAKMVSLLAEEWSKRSPELPVENAYEALILASIIEKETGLAEERPAIAGVFTRRLQMGMKLQTDPTVIYGLGDEYDGNLTRAHLKAENPYNTYFIDRLPPTPIANPGRESIHAALHPKGGTEVYFVARGDGSHQFSTTLEQHLDAVKRFQLRRVKNYRSAPQ